MTSINRKPTEELKAGYMAEIRRISAESEPLDKDSEDRSAMQVSPELEGLGRELDWRGVDRPFPSS